ncbi:hypothetical protein AB0G04_19595 [Actinoplanes sp. NPDC023801]|uniref:hypothetical protein n=1 Tax=Actinoplanes sp. NPDC023801 TaxID=3154595 RepID=UPI0033E7AB16
MSEPDEDLTRTAESARTGSGPRRKKAIAAAGALAALAAGAGVFMALDDDPARHASPKAASEPGENGEIRGGGIPGSAGVEAVEPDEAGEKAKAQPDSAKERVARAQKAGAERGVPVKRPLPQSLTAVVPEIDVKKIGSVQKGGQELRVASARADLTGMRELAWVVGSGEPFRSVRCSQTFKLSNETKPSKKPNLLICWRTSADKSVYTVMVDIDGAPSKQKSEAAIAKRWRQME